MATWNDRLNQALTESGMTPADLSRKTGATTASVSDWVNNITKELKASNSECICATLRINHRWLVTGKGPMRPSTPSQITEPQASYETPISPRLANLINQLDRDHLAKLEEIAELYAQQKGT